MSSSLDVSAAAREVKAAENQVKDLEKTLAVVVEETEDAELVSLKTQNAKLKYRKEFLLKSIAEMEVDGINHNLDEETDSTGSQMNSLLQLVKNLFKKAIAKAYPDLANAPVDVSSSSQKSVDYQCNSAMQVAKLLKTQGKPSNPREIATNLVNNIPPNNFTKKIEVAGPGFINVHLDESYLSRKVKDILIGGIAMRKGDSKSRVIVDYSSPNIAKEMHVGHLRSTIIGDCLANVFEFLGYDVLRLNHVGDWGTQFGMLLAHLVEKFPDYVSKPPPIGDLQAFYKEAKKRFDEEEDFKKRAYTAVVSLQSKEPEMFKAWQQICNISREEFADIYRLLNIQNLQERGESFYHDLMVDVVSDLEKKGLLMEDDGRKIMWPSSKVGGIPLTIVKTGGGFTYDTSDMACIKQRINSEKADRIVYCTDNGQATHFQLIFACARDASYLDSNRTRVDHVGFGVVLGEDKKKFKTRSGDNVRLRDLLSEGMERALAKLKEKERDKVLSAQELDAAQEAVAIGCIKYADLSNDRNHAYEFSFDRMLDDRGNTAVYLLYSLTRIRSIARNANLDKNPAERATEIGTIVLEHEKEIKLAKYILKFPEIILQLAEDLYPHSLCSYLYDLSAVFSEFYDKCYCIEKFEENGVTEIRINMSRILLCDATALVMEKGLTLLGIKTVSKM